MIEFHAGPGNVVKSTHTVFSIPPKRQLKEAIPKVVPKRLSKLQQAVRAMETPAERAARRESMVIAFKPQSTATYPSSTPEARALDAAKVANLKAGASL